jgi:hypothetical protein
MRRLASSLLVGLAIAAALLVFSRRSRPSRLPATPTANEATSSRPESDRPLAEQSPSAALSGSVRTLHGAAIARARVCAVDINSQPVGSPPSPCVDTASDGHYEFAALWPGLYYLRAAASGFLPGSANGGEALAIRKDETRSDVDIVLQKGGAELSGAVVDATGGPVSHAKVRVARTPSGDVVDVEADSAGHFAAPMSEGSVALTVWATGYATAHASAHAPSTGVVVVLTPGSIIRGTVVAVEDEQPVGDITVRAVPSQAWAGPWHPSATSAADGSFAIEGVEPGLYRLVAEGWRRRGSGEQLLEVGVATSIDGVVVRVAGALRVAGRVERGDGAPCVQGNVTLGPTQDSDSTVPILYSEIKGDGAVEFNSVTAGRYQVSVLCLGNLLQSGPTVVAVAQEDVTGIVWQVAGGIGLNVTVVDGGDRPVPGATVRLELPTPAGTPTQMMMLTTDSRGRYEYPRMLEPGSYKLSPTAGYHGPPVAVELRAGTETADATLRLEGSAAIVATVKTADGELVDGVTVVAVAADADAGVTRFQRRAQSGRIAAPLGRGQYRVGPLEPGSYEVDVEDRVNAPVAAKEPTGTMIRVAQSVQQVTVTLDRGSAIRGRVVDDRGDPVADVWVSALADSGGDPKRQVADATFLSAAQSPGQRSLTNLEGRFELRGLAADGRFMVRAEQATGSACMQRSVSPGTEVALQLPGLGSLKGRVTDPAGRPVHEFSIQATHVDSGKTRSVAVTSPDGSWSMDKVPAGAVSVVAVDSEGQMGSQDVTVAARAVADGIGLVLRAAAAPAREPPQELPVHAEQSN